MTTTDRFEPFLEPLYIPAVTGSIAAGFWGWAYTLSLNAYDPRMLMIYKVWAILLLCSIIISVLVVIYECLILFKVFPSVVLFKAQNRIYRAVRWFLGAIGLAYSAFTIYFLIVGYMFGVSFLNS